MATSNKSLVQQTYNTSSGTLPDGTAYSNWSVPVNYDFGAIDSAFGGSSSISVTGSSVSRSLTLAEYQPLTIIFGNGGGTPAADLVYSLPSGVGGHWIVFNNASNLSTKTLSIGTPAGTVQSVVVPSGGPWLVACNATSGISIGTSLVDGSVTTAKLASNAVTTVKITDANVTTAKIADANVTTAKIADANVTTAKILDANVTTAKIADSNVTTAKIADSNVTTAKIANAAVTPAKMSGAQSGSAPAFAVRAWGVFIGGSSPTVGVNGNIASITYVSAGIYTITMTTAMPQTSYGVAITLATTSSSLNTVGSLASINSTTSFTIRCVSVSSGGTALFDPTYISIIVMA